MAEYIDTGIPDVLWNERKNWTATQLQQYERQLQDAMQRSTDPNATFQIGGQTYTRQQLQSEVLNLQDSLERQYAKQGLVDEAGKLKTVFGEREKFMDKDYLREFATRQQRAEDQAISQSLKALRQNRMRGEQVQPTEAAYAAENVARQSAQNVTGALKQETQQAYNIAGQEMGRAAQYAQQLSQAERESIMQKMNMALQQEAANLNMSQQQVNYWMQKLANEGDGFLAELGSVLLEKGIDAGLAMLTGGMSTAASAIKPVVQQARS